MVTMASKLLCLQMCQALTTPDGYQVRQDILKCVHWPLAIVVMCGSVFGPCLAVHVHVHCATCVVHLLVCLL